MALRFALVVFAGLYCVSSIRGQAPANLRTDLLGDPLPAGAVARLGTLRFKQSFTRFFAAIPIGAEALIRSGTVSSAIAKVRFSPDGKIIASLDFTNLRLWEAISGKALTGPWSSSQFVGVGAFSSDSNLFALGGQKISNGRVSAEITVWDLAASKLIETLSLPPAETVQALAFASDGKTLISAGTGNVRWWDIATGQEKRSWKPFADEQQPFSGGTMTKTFFRCELSSGGNYLAVQSDWHYKLTDPPQAIRGFIAAGDQDNWGFDLNTTKPRWRTRVKATDFPVQFAFSADEKWVAQTVEGDKVELRETATGKLMATPPLEARTTQTQLIGALALSSDGATLAIGGPNSQVTMWNAAQPTKYRQFSGRITLPTPNSLRCLAFSPDNKALAAGLDSDLQIYDVASLKEVFPWDGHRGFVDYLAFTADGKRLVTGSATANLQPSEVVNWDMATWKATSIASNRTPKWPNIGTLSPDYSFFTGKDGEDRACIYDYATGKKVGRLDIPANFIPSGNGYFSPGCRFFLHVGPVGKGAATFFQLFAVPSGKLACALPPIGNAKGPFGLQTFSPDESIVAVSSPDALINVCDTATGEVQKRLGKPPESAPGFNRQGLLNLAFSSDNKMLAYLSSLDNVIHVWELTTGKERLRLPPGEQGRGQVKFAWSPDGRTLAVGDRKIQLIEVATGKLRREYEGHQGAILALAFSPDGGLLASGSADTTVLVWDVWGR
jgi:WD40 repeat protein